MPGGPVSNLFPNPDSGLNGPYAMCGKCHDLTSVLNNTSWTKHSTHVGQDGFTCSVCHTAHGMGTTSPNDSGERLMNFDVNVVGVNGSYPISYNRGTGTCVLMCHQVAHNPNGSVSSGTKSGPGKKK